MHAHAGRYFVARPYCNLVRFAPFFFVTQPGSAIYYWKILVRNPVNLYRLVKVLPICSKAVRRLTGGYWCASWWKYIFFCSCYTKPGAVERQLKTGNFDVPRTRIYGLLRVFKMRMYPDLYMLAGRLMMGRLHGTASRHVQCSRRFRGSHKNSW